MKIFFKILAGIIVILVALIIILPIVFKGEIIDLAKTEINKNVNATIDFSDMDVSLIKNFPNFSLAIEGLTIVGKDAYAGDTMADIKQIGIVIDLLSVIKGEMYEVKKVLRDENLSPIFLAAEEATQEAIYHSLFAAEDMTGNGKTIKGNIFPNTKSY